MNEKDITRADKIGDIADQLDDVKEAVDELEDEGTGTDGIVRRLKKAVDRALDAADELENQEG